MDELLTTVIKRPYVFAFFAAYLFLALRRWGWKRTLLWLVSGYLIAWVSEYSSIHNGFPYGHYKYVYEGMAGELMIAGVPFFDSLSYVFLTFAGFMTGWFVIARPLSLRGALAVASGQRPRGKLETATPFPMGNGSQQARNLAVYNRDHHALRARDDNWKTALKLIVLGAFLTMMLDVIVDPVATQGEKWFLGKIHYYVHPGWYFGVPLTNFAGWFLVALAIIGFNVTAWHAFPNALGGLKMRTGIRSLEPLLFLSVGLFQTVMALWIGAHLLGFINATLCAVIAGLLHRMNHHKTPLY